MKALVGQIKPALLEYVKNRKETKMKFECKKDELLNALETITPAISAKNNNPLLSNVLIFAQEKSLTFTATSLDITLSTSINITASEAGSILVPAQKLIAVVKELSDADTVSIATKENKALTLKSGNSVFKLGCMSAEKFPEGKITKTDNNVTITSATLKSLINKVSFAMLPDTSRPTLNGVLFEFVKDILTVVATDAKRIAVAKIKLIGEINASFILPMKSVNILTKMLGTGDVAINVEKSKVSFVGKETIFISNLIDGDFPAYEKAIPKAIADKLSIDKAELISALKKAALFTSPDSIAVKLNISTDKVMISKQTEIDDVQIKLPCKYAKEVTIGFNPTYLLEVLSSISDTKLEIEIDSGDTPALLRKKDEYTYVMLPTKI